MKYALISCAVFLGMAMAPVDPKTNPLDRPDVVAVREKARECQERARRESQLAACFLLQNRNLDHVLDRYIVEVEKLLPADQLDSFRNEQKGWNARQDRFAHVRPGSANARIQILTSRYKETLQRFRVIGKRVHDANAPKATPASPAEPTVAVVVAPVAPPATAPIAEPVAAPVPTPPPAAVAEPIVPPAPAPARPTVAAPVPAEASVAVRGEKSEANPAPATAANILSAKQKLPVVPAEAPLFERATASFNAMFRADVVRAQLMFTGCMQEAALRANPNSRRSVCELYMKQNLDLAMNTFFEEQLQKVNESGRKPLRDEQKRWKAERETTCKLPSSFSPPKIEREVAQCWYAATLKRIRSVAGLKVRSSN